MAGFAPAPVNAGAALEIGGDVNIDALDWLSPGAADKLRNLRQRSADLHGAIPNFEKRQEVNLARTECANRLARLTGRRTELSGTGFGFELSDDDTRVTAERAKLSKLTVASDRVNALYKTRSEEWQASSRALAAVEAWLKQGRPGGTTLADLAVEAPRLKTGESLQDGIARLRKRISELQAELARVENAPLPSAYCRQKAKAQIEILAARGKPNVSGLVTQGLDLRWPSERHSHPINGFAPKGLPIAGITAWEQPDALALVCWLHKTALLAAVDREITSEADDAVALAPEVRERTLGDIRVKLLDTERVECTLVWAALDQKLPIEFRADADPRAVLAVELIAAPATAAITGMHTFEIVG